MPRTAIISVDGHVKGSRSDYREYVDPDLRDDYDAYVKGLEDAGMPDGGNVRPEYGLDAQWDSAARCDALEAKGVVAEVVFPNGIPFQPNPLDDHAQIASSAHARGGRMAYNRWLVDFCAEVPGRRAGQALISFGNVEQGVREVEWAKEHGLGGIMLPVPSPRMFFDPELDPIWAACRDLDMTVSQHGGIGDSYKPAGYAALMTIAVESAFFSNRSLWQMIVGGVFERFPELRVAFVETQLIFMAPVVRLLDEELAKDPTWMEFAKTLGRNKPFTKKVGEYFHSNCFVGVSPFTPRQLPLDELLGKDAEQRRLPGFHVGADNAMFGVDYPHFESIFRTTMDEVTRLVAHPSVTAEDAQKILFDNAVKVFRFDRDVLAPHVERVGFDLDELASVA
jgi:predicted TIM-barrel fold metal-dependent hydrolase